jgi:hypothetical protein
MGMRNTRRMNRMEELGRVDAEKATTPMGRRNLMAEKRRIRGELDDSRPMMAKKGGMIKKKKQTKKDKMDESLGMRRGKESTKKQSYKDRRDESKGAKKVKKIKKTKPASTTKMGKVKTNSRPSGIAKKGLGLLGKKK